MEIKKIDTAFSLKVRAQGCLDDCYEGQYWVGRDSSYTPGCALYDYYTAKTTTWW